MFPEDSLDCASKLTERQREVLRFVCQGISYKDIAADLFVAESTVKAHMGNIYQKLGLDSLPPAQRRKVIYEVCCPGLGKPLPPPEGTAVEPETVPDSVARMVEEDERAIVPWEPAPLVAPAEIIEVRPRPVRALRLRWLVFGMILGAILVSGLIYAFSDLIFGETSTSEQEVVGVVTVVEKLVEVTVEVEKTVVVTAEPGPEQPTSPPQIVEVIVTATPLPTPIPSPIPTEPVNTPPDTILEVGEWWKHEGVWMKVSDVLFDDNGLIEISVEIWNKTGSDLIFEWLPTGNFSLVDNTGHHYQLANAFNRGNSNSEIVSVDELVNVTHNNYGTAASYFDSYFFKESVTDLTFTIIELTRVPFAQWHISVSK